MERVRRTIKQAASILLVIMLLVGLAPAALAEEPPQELGLTGALLVSDGLSVDASVDGDTLQAEVAAATQLLVLEGCFDEAVVQTADGQALPYDPAAGLELTLEPGENLYTVTLRGGDAERVYSLSVVCQAAAEAPEATEPEADEEAEPEATETEGDVTTAAAKSKKIYDLFLTKGLYSWRKPGSATSSEIKGFSGTSINEDGNVTYTTTLTTSWARPYLMFYSYKDLAKHTLELRDSENNPVPWGRVVPYNTDVSPIYSDDSYGPYITIPLNLAKGDNTYTLVERSGIGETYEKTSTYQITLKLTVEAAPEVAPEGFTLTENELDMPKNHKAYIGFVPEPAGATLPCNDLTWTSSNDGIATVDNYGYIKSSDTNAGTAIITATHATLGSKSCTVTVGAQVAAVRMEPTAKALMVGQAQRLVATLTPADTGRLPVWRTENDRVVKIVATGTDVAGEYYADVEAVGSGSGKVWATVDGKSAASQITVSPFTSATKLEISPARVTMQVGRTQRFESSLYDNADLAAADVKWTIVQGKDLGTLTSYPNGAADFHADAAGIVVVRLWSEANPALSAESRIEIIDDLSTATDTDLAVPRLSTSTVTVNVNGNAKVPFGVSLSPTGLQYSFDGADIDFGFAPVDETKAADKDAAIAAGNLFEVSYAGPGTLAIAYKGGTTEADLKPLASSYKVKLQVLVGMVGDDLTATFQTPLTIKVNKKPPTFKATDLIFNTFYDADRNNLYKAVDVAGLTISSLEPIASRNKTASKYVRYLTVEEEIQAKQSVSGSATMYFTATFDEYGTRKFTLPVKVKVNGAVPGVKLNTTKLTMPTSMASYGVDGMAMALKTKSSKQTLQGLGVKAITVVEKDKLPPQKGKNPYTLQEQLYKVVDGGRIDFSSGAFRIITQTGSYGSLEGAKSTKLLLQVSFEGSTKVAYLPLNIKASYLWKASLKPTTKSVTLNKDIPGGDPVAIGVTSNLSYPVQPLYTFTITKGGKTIQPIQWPLKVTQDGWDVKIAANGRANYGDTYKLRAKTNFGSSLTFTVKIAKSDNISLTGNVKGSLNLATRSEAALNLKMSGYQGRLASIKADSLEVTDASKKRNPIVGIEDKIDLHLGGARGTTVTVSLKDDLYADGTTNTLPTGSYYISDLIFVTDLGREVHLSTPVLFKVTTSKPKTSVTPGTAILFKDDGTDAAAVVRLNSAAASPIKSVNVSGSLGKTFTATYNGYGSNSVTLSYKDDKAAKKATGTKTVTLELELYGAPNVKTTAKVKIATK